MEIPHGLLNFTVIGARLFSSRNPPTIAALTNQVEDIGCMLRRIEDKKRKTDALTVELLHSIQPRHHTPFERYQTAHFQRRNPDARVQRHATAAPWITSTRLPKGTCIQIDPNPDDLAGDHA